MNARSQSVLTPFEGMGTVSKLSLPDQVYASLREELMSGRFAPGQRVPLRAIATAMGTSTMPVREAVNRLVATGALELLPNRRVSVPTLSEDRYRDLTKAKVLIESAAAEASVPFLTNEILERLRSLHVQMCEVASLPHNVANVQEYLKLNKDFHFTIYSISDSSALMNVIESLWLQVGPYFNLLHSETTGWRGNDRHKEILRALVARDPLWVRVSVRADLKGAADYILDNGLLSQQLVG
ncbi:GntR family transcriptional regulator [Aminobacter anthyllidis]|uniref:GntR family transcriptional regulator n=1 Tax=Aminobacter anthyllidis TaxID=1035067 RepID=A0A9X1AF09_9HYPH|nr:GntR family transcriptional regulator [Aminobacter anthyllidis]MBT1158622.1 GntR family transcriptional regulator [Aminobacter anthyllidis]